MNVVLVGFSGTGKSTVGRVLADRLGWQFVDTDVEVERVAGKRIQRVFEEDGEGAFRRMETEAVHAALRSPSCVVSVGGGAVLDPLNRRAMRDGHLVVLLDAGVQTIHRRLEDDLSEEPRPLLASADPLARIESLKASRDPVYREAAHSVVPTDDLDVAGVATRVWLLVRERLSARGSDPG